MRFRPTLIAAGVLTAVTALAASIIPAAAETYPHDPKLNHPNTWEVKFPAGMCVKDDNPSTPYTVPTPPTGWELVAVVIKAGAGESANEVWRGVAAGDVLAHPTGKDHSHVIFCKDRASEPEPSTSPEPAPTVTVTTTEPAPTETITEPGPTATVTEPAPTVTATATATEIPSPAPTVTATTTATATVTTSPSSEPTETSSASSTRTEESVLDRHMRESLERQEQIEQDVRDHPLPTTPANPGLPKTGN